MQQQEPKGRCHWPANKALGTPLPKPQRGFGMLRSHQSAEGLWNRSSDQSFPCHSCSPALTLPASPSIPVLSSSTSAAPAFSVWKLLKQLTELIVLRFLKNFKQKLKHGDYFFYCMWLFGQVSCSHHKPSANSKHFLIYLIFCLISNLTIFDNICTEKQTRSPLPWKTKHNPTVRLLQIAIAKWKSSFRKITTLSIRTEGQILGQ